MLRLKVSLILNDKIWIPWAGKGVILISSEEGETECNNDQFLRDFGLVDGNVLACDDFLQNYNLKVCT